MKVICIVLLCVASALARSAIHDVKAVGPECPIADPLVGEPGNINATLDPLFKILEGGTNGEIHATGLSTLWYEANINALLLTATFHLKLEHVELDTTYSAEGYIDARPLRQVTVPSGNFSGAGTLTLTAKNIDVAGYATLLINLIGNKVSVRVLNINSLTFDSITLDLGQGFIIADGPINWEDWSANFKSNFEADFAGQIKEDFVDKIRLAANNIIGQFTLGELIDLIGGGEGGDGSTKAPCTA